MSDTQIHFNHKGKGLTLEVRIDVPCMRRLRKYEEPIDIFTLVNKEKPEASLWAKMLGDPGIAVDICYEATRHDERLIGIGPEAFAEGLAGDEIEQMTNAAIASIVVFTPNRANRMLMQKVLKKTGEAIDEMTAATMKALESGEIDEMIEHELNNLTEKIQPLKSIAESGNSSGNSESTPAPSMDESKTATPEA